MKELQHQNAISVTDIVGVLQRHHRLLITGTLIGTMLGTAAASFLTPVYRAEALIAPAKETAEAGGASGISGQFGGLASLAGLAMPGTGDRSIEAIATLRSRTLTQAMVAEQNLLPVLFASDWDAIQGKWKTTNPKKEPTLWDANQLFVKKIRTVVEDKKTGLVTISISWTDPVLAAAWVKDLVSRTNKLLKERAIARAEKNMSFLRSQLDQTAVVEIRQAVYRLLETEIKNIMLAQGSDEYAFKIIDPAVVPEEPVWPRKLLFILLGFGSGLLLCSVFVLLAHPPTPKET